MEFFSSVPLVDPKDCPDNEDHNRLARQVNRRLTRSGPDCLWRIFYFADSIFTGMRNTATPGRPLGVNPAEDEWWKVYMTIEHPVASTGVGNWPLTLAGTPQGANVMNPLNAYIFGRKTAENKFLEKQGPWAEGNIFDGLVSSSRAVLSNKQYWEDAYMQRGALARNTKFNIGDTTPWEGYSVFGAGRRIEAKYLPNPEDPVFLSTSLTAAATSSDRYFQEYASNYVYMRYPPAIQGGKFIKYLQAKNAPQGVLKRKNAAKDLLQWGLWCYVYFFRGSENQRSLFCDKKNWRAKVVDYNVSKEYKQSLGVELQDRDGPLNICKVGFDFYKYFTRQNVFAPALGLPTKFKATDGMVAHKGYYELDDIGNKKVEPYRVSFKAFVKHNQSNLNNDNKEETAQHLFAQRNNVFNSDTIVQQISQKNGKDLSPYGKIIGFSQEELNDYQKNKTGLFKCDYDNHKSGRVGRDYLNFDSTSGRGTSNYIKSCIAGYYLETDAIEDRSCRFKFRIWSNGKIVHETIITSQHSYRVNRNGTGRAAYIFNKMFYFKEGLEPKGAGHKFRFEIVPVLENFAKSLPNVKKYIPLGNPWSNEVASTHELTFNYTNVPPFVDRASDFWPGVAAPASIKGREGVENSYIHVADFASNFSNGDMVRVKCIRREKQTNSKKGEREQDTIHLNDGNVLFVRKTKNNKIYFSRRQDDRLFQGSNDESGIVNSNISSSDGIVNIHEILLVENKNKYSWEKIVVEKLTPPENIFKAKVDLAILQKRKPTFQDAYALLRVATTKQNRRNTSSRIIIGDDKGVGVVGHAFSEANRVFKNYYRYGSAMNIYGSSAVPALRQFVSANPIYESMRKFVGSFMRFADRQQLINYKVENEKGVLYFKRFAWGLSKKYKSTILRNMEPSIDPAGWFVENTKSNDSPGHSRFVPIRQNQLYKVACGEGTGVVYMGKPYSNGRTFTGGEKDHLDQSSVANPESEGAFEVDGIYLAEGKVGDHLKYVTNDWIMFMTSSHYHTSNSHIYKPSVYNDIMGFLNNRCHHRSKEYEDSHGDQYDMIRSELLRTPTSPRNTVGQLQVFLSKSSPNFNYIFNTNHPDQGNVDLYSETGNGKEDYFNSCPAITPRPYKVTSTRVVNANGGVARFNPSSKKIDGKPPFEIVRVELNRPLRGTGRLSVGSKGWAGVSPSQLKKEPYRTDENAVIEYLHHRLGGYQCKRNMIGDYGSNSEVIEGDGYRPFGACYPRFYFLKLIPRVPNGALLDSEPYAQMDFYFRAMAGGFVSPYPVNLDFYNQTSSLNWKFSEIASRSSEEDPTLFDYIDPREITS